MKTIVIALLFLASSQVLACPDLSGKYMFSSGTTLHVTQNTNARSVSTYSFAMIEDTCRACKYSKTYQADGQARHKRFMDNIRIETTKAYCSEGTLHVRMKATTYDGKNKVATFTDNYDYSLDDRMGLVETEIKDGRIYRSSTHYRLADEFLEPVPTN